MILLFELLQISPSFAGLTVAKVWLVSSHLPLPSMMSVLFPVSVVRLEFAASVEALATPCLSLSGI